MKKCPFCAEEIQPEAIKCRYCSNDVGDSPEHFAVQERKEIVLYSDDTVYVTNSMVVIGSSIYPLETIAFVALEPALERWDLGDILRSTGVVLAVIGVPLLPVVPKLGVIFSVPGAVVYIVGRLLYKPEYAAVIYTASGLRHAVTSYQQDYCEHIVSAMNDALAKRGG